jgi:glycosyltransferase involved in cell wall biosynthesis
MNFHILIIPSEHFVTKSNPLAGIFQLHQANALHKAGHKIGVISPGLIPLRLSPFSYRYDAYEDINGIPVIRRYKRLFSPYRLMPFNALKKAHAKIGLELFGEYLNKFGKPDIVHAHNIIFAGFIASDIKEKYNIPIVLTEHSSSFARAAAYLPSIDDLRSIGRRFNALTAVSSSFISLLSQNIGFTDVGLLPNIVDDYYFSSPINKKNKHSNTFVFLNIASLDSNKNHEHLIRSFTNHFKSSNVLLKIGGDGPLLNYLKDLCKEIGIENQVQFLGRLNQCEVKEEMMKADCFVLSSKYETFGVVLIEALACGTPVIATKCGGPEDIVNESNGRLVDIEDLDQMGEAMEYIIEHVNDYNPEILRNDVKLKFGSASFVTNAVNIYTNAISSQ